MTSAAGQREKDETIKGEVEMERGKMVGGEGRLGGMKTEKDKSSGGEQVRTHERKRWMLQRENREGTEGEGENERWKEREGGLQMVKVKKGVMKEMMERGVWRSATA